MPSHPRINAHGCLTIRLGITAADHPESRKKTGDVARRLQSPVIMKKHYEGSASSDRNANGQMTRSTEGK